MEQEYLKEILLYSPRKGVFYWVRPPKKHAELVGEEVGNIIVANGKQYHVIQIRGKKYKRSRLAFLFMEGRWPSDQIDHISGDSLDDRWMNLREATPTQNAWNHKGRAKKTDLPMGVRQNSSGRYSARIGVYGKQVQLGTFDTAEEAASEYAAGRRKYYGDFA